MSNETETHANHFKKSNHREKIIEHLFIGELLRQIWQLHIKYDNLSSVDILKPEVDATGYDLVVVCGAVMRHIQLKTSLGLKPIQQINASLAQQPSGCVVWIIIDNDLNFKQFLWFGDTPHKSLPSLDEFAFAKHHHTRQPRDNTKEIPKRFFQVIENADMSVLVGHLFGNVAAD